MSTPDRTFLHVTNGDIAAERIRACGIGGEVLPWRDVLHEGPVPAGLPLEALSEVRARFIAGRAWGEMEEVRTAFVERDRTLARFADFGETVLWFEHDLYDQLQLLQILDRLAEHPGEGRVSLVVVGSFPGIPRFDGLGQLTPEQIATLFPARQPLIPDVLELARAAWAAFRSPDPTEIEHVLEGDTSALPFLRGALRRHLEQFPAVGDGLSRTERQILQSVAGRAGGPMEVFLADQAREEHVFMGDTTLWTYLHELALGPAPLLRVEGSDGFRLPGGAPGPAFREQRLELTERGRQVLRGEADRVALGGIDRWLGGVHLEGREVPWRWDRRAGKLVGAGG